MSTDLAAISLYTGAGGLDVGLEAAGFRVAVALEVDAHCCETLRLNRPTWNALELPIAEVSTQKLLRRAGLRKGEARLLAGGPPCQPFSKSSYWSNGDTRRLNDPRADTLTAFMRVVKEALPEVFVLENVYGLVYRGKDEGLKHLLKLIDSINEETGSSYGVTWRVLNAAEYGVPQVRERAFLVGSRDGKRFDFPAPTFAEPGEMDGHLFTLPPYRTAWDAIGDLPDHPEGEDLAVRGKWAELLPSIPEGENYLWHTERRGGLPLFGWRTRYWSFLLKLAKSRPSWTLQATPGPAIGPFHWANRRLSTREMLRIQTFPEDFKLNGSRTEVQRQVGNAVPALLAEVLGREIRTQLLGERKLRGKLKLLPPNRSPVPPPEKPRPVPEGFRHLIGEHAAHPGTGKGPRAFAVK